MLYKSKYLKDVGGCLSVCVLHFFDEKVGNGETAIFRPGNSLSICNKRSKFHIWNKAIDEEDVNCSLFLCFCKTGRCCFSLSNNYIRQKNPPPFTSLAQLTPNFSSQILFLGKCCKLTLFCKQMLQNQKLAVSWELRERTLNSRMNLRYAAIGDSLAYICNCEHPQEWYQ